MVLKTLLLAVGVTLWLPPAAQSAEESNPVHGGSSGRRQSVWKPR